VAMVWRSHHGATLQGWGNVWRWWVGRTMARPYRGGGMCGDGGSVAPWRDPTGAIVWRWGEAGKAAGREELPLSKRYILEYDLIRGCFLSL
ncbi:MAG: hypothetical protein ACI31B_00005, partial [Muribaculaceae bacterium]